MGVTRATFAVLVTWLCCLFTAHALPPSHQAESNLLGQICSPPFGFERKFCGPEILISLTSTSVPDYLYGPNTCRITQVVQTNELEYKYQNYCAWVVNYQYYSYIYQCIPFCMPTSICTDMNKTFERSNFECCEDFQVRRLYDQSPQFEYLYRLYYSSIPTIPLGCPVAVGDTVFDCLELLELTEFLDILDKSDFVNQTDFGEIFTLFVPTNAAIEAVRDQLDLLDPTMVVGNHVVGRALEEKDLTFNQRFRTVLNLTIHSTTVVFGHRTLYNYNSQRSYNNPSNFIHYTNVRFIGASRIVNADACFSVNVTLHVIDRVLMPGVMTIASILDSNPNFSEFTAALRFTKVFNFLDKEEGVSRTVFVPTNEAFARRIPSELFACLMMYMRLPLSDFVLYHIAEGAEFTTSLSLREAVVTLQLTTLRLMSTADGNITFLTNPQSTIVIPDITASNGVIHVISDILLPSGFDFGMCSGFVPTTMTTPPPTTMTTPPPTTMTTPPPTTMTTPPPATMITTPNISLFEGEDDIDYDNNP